MFECMLLARSDFQVHHEPMGEAWYYGEERASPRFDEAARIASGNADATYAQVRSYLSLALLCVNLPPPRQSWREVAKPHPTMRTFSKGKSWLGSFCPLSLSCFESKRFT